MYCSFDFPLMEMLRIVCLGAELPSPGFTTDHTTHSTSTDTSEQQFVNDILSEPDHHAEAAATAATESDEHGSEAGGVAAWEDAQALVLLADIVRAQLHELGVPPYVALARTTTRSSPLSFSGHSSMSDTAVNSDEAATKHDNAGDDCLQVKTPTAEDSIIDFKITSAR